MTDILQSFDTQVPREFFELLTMPYTCEEFRVTLFKTKKLKFPRPYGFSACFYDEYWITIKNRLPK